MANGIIWTKKDDDKLRTMYLSGMGVEQIAQSLNRSVIAVTYRVSQKLRLRRTQKPKLQIRRKKEEYIDCMPNPFTVLKGTGFPVNFYRTI